MLNPGVNRMSEYVFDLKRLRGGGHVPVARLPAKQTIPDTAANCVCLKACLL